MLYGALVVTLWTFYCALKIVVLLILLFGSIAPFLPMCASGWQGRATVDKWDSRYGIRP